MHSPLHTWLAREHIRLEALLGRSVRDDGTFEAEPFEEFRAGLLRHIAIEEKVLLPDAALRRGAPLPDAQRLREDHSALSMLVIPTPSADTVREIRSILQPHNELEEGPGGIYEAFDALAGDDASALLLRAQAVPPVRLPPHRDYPPCIRSAALALELSRAGKRAAPRTQR
jgi:hypothetical protein